MEKKAAVVCGTAGLLGLFSVLLGFAGERTKSQSLIGYDGVNCVYRATPAVGCGAMAALFLLAAQAVIAAATACCGCCRKPKVPCSGTKRIVAVAMAVVSWVLMFVAVAMFIAAARWNTAMDRAPAVRGSTSSEGECYVLQGGVFTTASVLSLVVVAFGITSYFLLGASTPASLPETTQHPGRIAMGQPAPYFQPHNGWPYDGRGATVTISDLSDGEIVMPRCMS